MNETPPPDRFPYPRHLVVGSFASEQALANARDALKQRGFESDSWDVLHGEQDARRLDPEGTAHGIGGELFRALQSAFSFEHEHAREHAERLRSGEYVLGVSVGRDQHAKQRAAQAMRVNGGDFINYYADTNIEAL